MTLYELWGAGSPVLSKTAGAWFACLISACADGAPPIRILPDDGVH
jgi:hypothetical protein